MLANQLQLILLCYFANLLQAAPAPAIVTVVQTVTSGDASLQTSAAGANDVQQAATPASNVDLGATTAAAATVAATTTSSGFWNDLLNSLQSSSAASSSSSSSSSDTSTGSSSGSSFSSFLSSLFGGNSDSSTSSTASTSSTSSSSGGSSFWDRLSGLLSGSGSSDSSASTTAVATPANTVTPSTSSSELGFTTSSSQAQPSTYSSSSSSSSPSDIYAAIADSDDVDASFATDILDAHNQYRAQHQAGDLAWDVDTYNYAKNNADNYDCSGILTHTHGQYGENLAAGFKDGPSAVKAWYDEGETYDYSTANEYNHFTQVVWKGSTKVGCAYKDCRSTGWGLYIVCEYDPAGNIIGWNKANVLP
ncbi:Cysteine-rich secretory family protein [Candida parapsilosis]|nr:Cysteine-rich secretory family protein [Candida parapsilosis]KAF6056351.1 Cysteine-rich secretory family protein [Candida parapsilosis]KAF6059285.1 Cysteine-rich secretory family protein [Candida parapsilosis]KAF6068041.1 Cysteine-rich secretory family protein [Candida parapsilosis]KAI5904066.1 Secreted protein PRY1 [Candida parapsilosis]